MCLLHCDWWTCLYGSSGYRMFETSCSFTWEMKTWQTWFQQSVKADVRLYYLRLTPTHSLYHSFHLVPSGATTPPHPHFDVFYMNCVCCLSLVTGTFQSIQRFLSSNDEDREELHKIRALCSFYQCTLLHLLFLVLVRLQQLVVLNRKLNSSVRLMQHFIGNQIITSDHNPGNNEILFHIINRKHPGALWTWTVGYKTEQSFHLGTPCCVKCLLFLQGSIRSWQHWWPQKNWQWWQMSGKLQIFSEEPPPRPAPHE